LAFWRFGVLASSLFLLGRRDFFVKNHAFFNPNLDLLSIQPFANERSEL